jgi:signal peptidase
MYPELAMYDIIVISGHISFDDVKIGDIIVFDRPKDHDRVIVHRVVAVVDDDPKTLRTKGDNNQQSIVGTDYPITNEEYIGKVVHVVPQVGFITKILQPPINYIIIAVIIGIMIIRQISKNKKKALTKPVLDDYNESQPAEKIDLPEDAEYVEPKDSTTQESKSTENSDQEKKAGDIPEFFSDKAKEFEEKK